MSKDERDLGIWERDLFARIEGVRVKFEYDIGAYKMARGVVRYFPEFVVTDLRQVVDQAGSKASGFRKFLMESLVEDVMAGRVVELVGSCGYYTYGENRDEDVSWAKISLANTEDEAKAASTLLAWEAEKHPEGMRRPRSTRTETTYRLLKTDVQGALPRQAGVILNIILDASGNDKSKVFPQSVVDALMVAKAELLKTRQPPERIFAFYKNRLVEEGYLEEVEATTTVAELPTNGEEDEDAGT